MQQVLIALRLYVTGTFQRVTGDVFGVSVFAACSIIHKVSRAIAGQKGQFLSFTENLADTKRKFYDFAHFHFSPFFHLSLHFSLFMTLTTFHNDVNHAPLST